MTVASGFDITDTNAFGPVAVGRSDGDGPLVRVTGRAVAYLRTRLRLGRRRAVAPITACTSLFAAACRTRRHSRTSIDQQVHQGVRARRLWAVSALPAAASALSFIRGMNQSCFWRRRNCHLSMCCSFFRPFNSISATLSLCTLFLNQREQENTALPWRIILLLSSLYFIIAGPRLFR